MPQVVNEVRSVDAVVIGGGVAGMTAALFLARHGHSAVVVAGVGVGGALLTTEHVEDFPGLVEPMAGYDLCPNMEEQARKNGVDFHMDDAESIRRFMGAWIVMTASGGFRTNAIVVATGKVANTLEIRGFEEFEGRGISHCAGCDGPLFRDRPVAVLGGGDSALQESLVLAEHVSEVHLFVRGPALEGQATYATRVRQEPKVRIHYGLRVVEIVGDELVTGVRVSDTNGETTDTDVASVFPYVGGHVEVPFLDGLCSRDETGAIVVDQLMQTDVEGIFAAGDVRSGAVGQAAAAIGDGATAGVAASRYLHARAGAA